MIVKLTGGLGNQLFMYAFGRSVAAATQEPELKFHWCRSTWDYALEPFMLPIEMTEPYHRPAYEEKAFTFDPKVYYTYEGSYFKGYWQSEKYFNADLLRRDFEGWMKSPVKTLPYNHVFIHVRRGDYMNRGTKEFHGTLSTEYYQAAIDFMKSQMHDPIFWVFTDDLNIKEFMGYPVISKNDQHVDLLHMTRFSSAILANSTFGWWGAWLGNARNVVAPKQWFADPKIDTSDLIPERWVRL